MSLTELLKEPENTSEWKTQRKKLVRIILGVSIVIIAFVGGAILLFDFKENELPSQVLSASDEQEKKAITDLLRLRQEASSLKKEIHGKNLADQVSSKKAGVIGSKKSSGRTMQVQQPPKTISEIQIIDFDPGEGFTKLDIGKTDLYIPTGAVFRARLITPIKTSVAKTFVLAETTNEFRIDMKRRIPKGSRLVGRSRLNTILKGVIVEFDTLVLPNAIETSINGLALSRNALPEIDGLYFSDNLQNYGTALAFGFLSGFSDAAQTSQPNVFGYNQTEQSVSNQVLSGVSVASFQVAEDILRDIRTKAVEYVVVPAGEPIFVALTSRYDLNQKDMK